MPTFYDRFIQCAERWPTNIAVEVQKPNGLESYTYGELRGMAESIAGWLAQRGIQPGARIAILADNHPRWVAAYLGIIAAGGTTVPLDTAYHADQVRKLLLDSGSVLLISDEKHLDVATAAAQGSEVGIVLTNRSPEGDGRGIAHQSIEADFDSIFSRSEEAFSPVSRAPGDVASLLYTSGTTADPKGVMLTH